MWGCNEYDQCRYSRERQCRVPPSYCPNSQIESCRNECYSPNNYNICTEQTLRWLCRNKAESRRSCSAPPRRLTYEGGTLSVERGKSPPRPKSRKMSPRKKTCDKPECPMRKKSRKKEETCLNPQCEMNDAARKSMEEKLRSLKTCGQPGCQASRQKKQIEEAVFGSMKCDLPTSPCCTEKLKTQVSLKAKSYKEDKRSSLVQDHEYLYFMLGITEDILKNNKYTIEEMEKVFKSHIAAYRGRLDEAKMQEHIDHLKEHLNYPVCVCDEQVGTDDECRCCPALTVDPRTNQKGQCSCGDSNCPAHATSESAVVRREGSRVGGGSLSSRQGSGSVRITITTTEGGGEKGVRSREGSGVVRIASVEGGSNKRSSSQTLKSRNSGSGTSSQTLKQKSTGSGTSSQAIKPKNTSTGRIWKEGSGTGGGGEGKTKTDDTKKKAYGTVGRQSSAQEVRTTRSSSLVKRRASGGSKEKNTRIAADNTQECIDPAICGTNPGNTPAVSLSKANFTISGIDNVRIRETNNNGKAGSKTEDKLSEVVFYNPEVGSTCHCTIAIRKTALKIQSDGYADNDEYVLVEGPVCMPKSMLQQKTVPVLIENISTMLLDSDSDLENHKKREGPSESRVNLFQSSTARNSVVVDANMADSISGYITIADLKTKDINAKMPQRKKTSAEKETESGGAPHRQSIVQIKPNASYISISVSVTSKSTGSEHAKIGEAVPSDQNKNNTDKKVVNKNRRKEVLTKENSSVYHERGGDDMLYRQEEYEVKTMSEPIMKTNYSYMSYMYESWTRLITSDADIKYFTSGYDKKGFVIKPPPKQIKAHKEENDLSCNSESSEENFYIPRRVKSENMNSTKEVSILNDLDKLLQKDDTRILYVERLLTDADQDIAIIRKSEISNDTMQSANTLNDTETLSITNKDDVNGQPKNINTLTSLDLEGIDVEYKMKSESVASINNETRVYQNNLAKQQESLAETSKTESTKETVCAIAKEIETLLSQVKIPESSIKNQTNVEISLGVEIEGSKSKNKLTSNNQAAYKTALARFELLKPKLKNITITKSDPTQDRHASTTFRLCTGEKAQSDSPHSIHATHHPKSKEVVTTTDEPPSQKDLSDYGSKYHYLLQDAVTNVSSADFCNIDDAFKENPKEEIQENKDLQTDVPCETLITLEPVTTPSPIVLEMPILVPSAYILEEAQLQGGSSPFYFPQLGTGYLTRTTRPSASQTHDKKPSNFRNSHTDESHKPPDSNKGTHPTKCSVTNAEISKEENLSKMFEFSNRGQKRSMDFAIRPGAENYAYQQKRKSLSGVESSDTKNPVIDREYSYCSPILFPTHAASISSTDDRSSSVSETSLLQLKNKERPKVTRSLNLEGDDHAEIIAQLDEIPEPDRTPNQISAIRDVTMKMEDFRTIDPSSVARKFPYTNPESFNIRRESFEY